MHETRSLEELDRVARERWPTAGPTRWCSRAATGRTWGACRPSRGRSADSSPRVAFAPGGTVSTVARNLGWAPRAPPRWGERLAARRVRRDGTRARRAQPPRARRRRGRPRRIHLRRRPRGALLRRVRRGAAPGHRSGRAARAPGLPRLAGGGAAGAQGARARRVRAWRSTGTPQPSRAWSLVLASVVRDVGLGVRATYRAGESLDRFHVVASTLSPRGLATQVPRVLSGRPMRGAGHTAVDAWRDPARALRRAGRELRARRRRAARARRARRAGPRRAALVP